MKKLLSTTLAFILLLTSFVTVFSFQAMAENVDLIGDGKFEGEAVAWQQYDNSSAKDAAFTIHEESGKKYAAAKAGGAIFKPVSLKGGVSYTVSFEARLTGAEVPASYDSFYRAGFTSTVAALGNSIFLGPYNTGNKYYSIYAAQKKLVSDISAWATHTFTYTPTEDLNAYFTIGSYNSQGLAGLEVDNVFICQTEDLVHISVQAGAGGTVFGGRTTYKNDTVTVTAVPDNGYELAGWYHGTSLVSTNAAYSFTAAEDITVTAQFRLVSTSADMIVGGSFDTGLGSGFKVYKNGTSADFTTNLVTETDGCITGNAGLSLFYPVHLTAGTEYTMSFDFKFSADEVPSTYDSFYRAGFTTDAAALGGSIFVGPNAVGNKYYSIYAKKGDDQTVWKTHTFTFTPSADMDCFAVIGSYNQQGVASFSINNWHLCKTSDLLQVTVSAQPGGRASKSQQVIKGETVTVTAVADTGYNFTGWYSGTTQVSTDSNYSFVVTQNVNLTAHFEAESAGPKNFVINGDFEDGITSERIFDSADLANAQEVMRQNAGKWGRVFSGVTVMNLVDETGYTGDDSASKNGSAYLQTGATSDANAYIRGLAQFVYLKAGSYVLSFDAKNNSDLLAFGVWKAGSTINQNSDTVIFKQIPQSAKWQTYTYRFEITADQYYQIGFGGNATGAGASLCLDNISIYHANAFVTVTPTAGTGGTVSATVTVLQGESVTVTATPQENYEFVGWYQGEAAVSTDSVYTFAAEENVNLTAKFQKIAVPTNNLLKNGDFEEPVQTNTIFNNEDNANAQQKMQENAGQWGRVFSTVTRMDRVAAADFEPVDSPDYNGTGYLKSGSTANGNYVRGFAQFVYLTPGDYVLSFIARANFGNTFSAGVWNKGSVVIKVDSLAYTDIAATAEWTRYTLSFQAEAAGYYQVGFGGNGTAENAVFCLDNVLLCTADKFTGVTVSTAGGGTVTAPLGSTNVGDVVTVKAVANEGYVFSGWYENNTFVSPNAEYTFTVTKTVHLTAKFSLNIDPEKMIKNGDFEYGSDVGWENVGFGGSGFQVVKDPDTGNFAASSNNVGGLLAQRVSLTGGVEYAVSFDFKFSDYDAVPAAYDSFYRSGFTSNIANLNNSSFIGPYDESSNVYYSIHGKNKSKDNAWHTYSYSFTPKNNLECWFVVGCVSNMAVSKFSVDNVRIFDTSDSVLLSCHSVSWGGSGTVNCNVQGYIPVDSTVHFSAVADKGSVFGGWYCNGVLLSKAADYDHVSKGSEEIYGVFYNANEMGNASQFVANYNFSNGLTGWHTNNVSKSVDTVTLKTENGKNFAHLGRDDMISQTVAFEPGYTYRISFTTRADPKNVNTRDQYSYLRAGVSKPGTCSTLFADFLTEGSYKSNQGYPFIACCKEISDVTEKRNYLRNFNTYSLDFGNYTDHVILADVTVGIPYYLFPGEMDVAAITVTRYSYGVVDYEPENLYGEQFYNVAKNADFEGALSDSNWGAALPKGFQLAGSGSNHYLSVQNAEKTFAFNAVGGNNYLVAMSVMTASAGNSRIEIVDEKGNPLGDCVQVDPRLSVLRPTKTDGSWQRVGMYIFLPNNVDKIYIKIIGAQNQLNIDDVMIIRTRNSTVEDLDNVPVKSFDYDSAVYYNPTLYYAASSDGTVLSQAGTNAATGDASSPIVLLILLSAGAMLLLASAPGLKRKKRTENREVL